MTDIYDEAWATTEVPPRMAMYFGQIQVDTQAVILVRGTGKVPFDPSVHKPAQKHIAIDFHMWPLPSSGIEGPIDRNCIAKSNEWVKIIRPSIEAIGTDIRAIQNAYVQVELVPDGRKYKDRNTGEEKDSTTFKFHRLFASEAECIAASDAYFGGESADEEAPAPAPAAPSQPAAQPTRPAANGAPKVDPQRVMAAKFLKPMWAKCGGDPEKFEQMIKGNGLTAKHFDLNSPEVIEIVTA